MAIEKGGYNSERIKNILYGVKNYPGVNGSLTFDSNGDVIKSLVIKTVRNGKFIVVKQ
ncbi:unnamed protein product [marine sediment metagenome]|uniref:Leucine-binding protein domain-containing protein n=1 Tax=marine sediment metagenome TaxID=412755 RepID=X1PYJ4_9ZZZZ